jgi:pimeloyl-ACP methyl ester carboxylesterase
MNAPIPNHYDPENARALCQASAAAYRSDGETVYRSEAHLRSTDTPAPRLIHSSATDTRAVISELPTPHSELSTDLVLSFRGTADLRNWLTDLDCKKAPLYWSAGKVHRGFNLALESVAEELDAAIDPDDQRRLWVTGHSLGGALAMLFALRLKVRRGLEVAGVYTFGQPRVGDISFSMGYDTVLKGRTFRVVHADDLVPRVPWLLGTFRHAGHEVFYHPSPCPLPEREGAQTPAFPLPLGEGGRRPGEGSSFILDRPWWAHLASDLRELARDRLAPLNDHHVSRYVELLAGVEQASGLSVLASGQNNPPFHPGLGVTPKPTGGTPVPPPPQYERF